MRTTLVYLFFTSFLIIGCGGEASEPLCDESNARERSDQCWIRDFSQSTNPYPNPLANNGTLNIDAQFGAVNTSMQFLNTNISVRVWTITGQLVSDQNVGSYPPSSNIQTIPIWAPSGVAAGTYSLEVIFDFGVCGSEILCIDKVIVTGKT